MKPILLTWPDLALASLLLLADGVLSVWLQLGLHRRLGLAAARMVAQLVAVGLVLRVIFAVANPAITLVWVLAMVALAAR